MKEILLPTFLYTPASALWLMAAAWMFRRRPRLPRVLAALALVSLVVACVPLFGSMATRVLTARVITLEGAASGRDGTFGIVLVPTGGSFLDPAGRDWPEKSSIERAAAGLVAARRLGLPLVISGGPMLGEASARSEAETMAARLDAGSVEVWRDDTARDSCGTATALAGVLAANGKPATTRVLLVTSAPHTRRMGACLSAAGFDWRALPVGEHAALLSFRQFVPRSRAAARLNTVIYETAGLIAYVVSGRISLRHLL